MYLFTDVGYSNNFSSFGKNRDFFAFYENPSLLVDKNSTMFLYFKKYGFKDLEGKGLLQSVKYKKNLFGFYVYHFQEKPYSEREYGFIYSRFVTDNLKFGINLKLYRNYLVDKYYSCFSYDVGIYYEKNNHQFALSFKDLDRPTLKEKVNPVFIGKYSFQRKKYRLNMKYVKNVNIYDYFNFGAEYYVVNFLSLSYGINTRSKENKFGVSVYKNNIFVNIGYVVPRILNKYIIVELGLDW